MFEVPISRKCTMVAPNIESALITPWGDCAYAAGWNVVRIAALFGFRPDKIANDKSRLADRMSDGRSLR